MIRTKKVYTEEHKKRIERFYKDLMKKAEFVGEDGDMVCNATTKRGAWIKIRKAMRKECGDHEANEIKIDDIKIGWLHLVDKDNKDHEYFIGEGSEWYASWSGGDISDYELFVVLS